MMLVSKLKVATLVLLVLAGTGLILTGSGAIGARQERKPEAPKPPPIATAKAQAPVFPKWAHLTSDAGFESWVRLEDGRSLWKSEEYAGVHDPASGIELNYPGNGPIIRRPDARRCQGQRRPERRFRAPARRGQAARPGASCARG